MKKGWEAERSVSEVFLQRDRFLNREQGQQWVVGCEMALELNLKAAKARVHEQTTLGRNAQHMNRAPVPLCHCALSPRQAQGNMDYGTVFPSGLAGMRAFLGRVVAGRWTAPLLWLRHSDMFAISS